MTLSEDESNQLHQSPTNGGGDESNGAEAERQRRPVWNTPSISNPPEVMGAVSWPALSESAKASSKASSSHSADPTPKTQAPAPNNQLPDPKPIIGATHIPPQVGAYPPGIHNNIASTSAAPFNMGLPYVVPRAGIYNPRPIFPDFPGPMDPNAVSEYLVFPRGNMGHRHSTAFGMPNGNNGHQRPFHHRPPLMNPPPFMPPPPVRPYNPMDYNCYFHPYTMETYVAPVPLAMIEPSLSNSIRNQVEYYFSDDNLDKDSYLREQMDKEGWVSIALVANFNRVRHMTSNLQVVIDAMKSSVLLDVKDDSKVRTRNWKKWVNEKKGNTSASQNGA